jgi:Kef-type K+ transport system membrane component KefB
VHVDHLLIQIAAVLAVSLVFGRVVRWLGQPTVIAEILAGIALGPSLLGMLSPEAMTLLFPPESMPQLGTVAELGLVFFMFLVGLEFDPRLLHGRLHAALAISGAGIVVPLVTGIAVALWLPADLAGPGVSVHSFALFVGVAMSVTAFPVLARILTERRLVKTPVGAMALAAAAVDDVTAWCLLALVVGITSASGVMAALTTVGMALAYAGLVWFGARPTLRRLGPRDTTQVSVELMTGSVLLVVVSALITEKIGIHALFGGFLIGAAMPRQGGLSAALSEKLEDYVMIVLLPLFFAYSGLRTEFGLLHSVEDLGLTLLLLAVATLGKFGGSALAALMTGLGRRESAAIGVLMNTRGLMEIVVLNVGLDLGVISQRLFAMMVIVAVVTTWMTTPILRRLYAPDLARDLAPEPTPIGVPAPAPAGIMLCVSDPRSAGPLVWLAAALVRGREEPVWVVHLRPVERPHQYLKQDAQQSEPLEAVERTARLGNVQYEAIEFSSSEPEQDLVRIATLKGARLVLLGMHRSTFGSDTLGGVTAALLRDCEAAVGILLDRGLTGVQRFVADLEGDSGGAVAGLAGELRRGGAEAVAPGDEVVADLILRAVTPDVTLATVADTSLLLVRGAQASHGASGPRPTGLVG